MQGQGALSIIAKPSQLAWVIGYTVDVESWLKVPVLKTSRTSRYQVDSIDCLGSEEPEEVFRKAGPDPCFKRSLNPKVVMA